MDVFIPLEQATFLSVLYWISNVIELICCYESPLWVLEYMNFRIVCQLETAPRQYAGLDTQGSSLYTLFLIIYKGE